MDELTPEQTAQRAAARADFERAGERYADTFGTGDDVVVIARIEILGPSGWMRRRRLRWRFARSQTAA